MSQRGRELFDQYVSSHLKGPLSHALGIPSHVHTLLEHCKEQGVSPDEVVEEVGELIKALSSARKKP